MLLSGVPLCLTSQVLAADDVSKAANALTKLYKLDKSISGYLFGSFGATDEQANNRVKYKNNGKKSGSPGLKVRGLKSLQYKIDRNQTLDLKGSSLSYVFKIQF